MALNYALSYGRSPAESLYLFDQRLAHTGIRYQVELERSGNHAIFVIRVPASSAAKVGAILAQIGRR